MSLLGKINEQIRNAQYGMQLGRFAETVREHYGEPTTVTMEMIGSNLTRRRVHTVGDKLHGADVVDAHLDAIIDRVAAGRRSGPVSE